MEWDEIEAAVGPDLVDALSGWRSVFEEQGHDVDDRAAFVRWLHDTGRIPTLVFQKLHMARRVFVSSQAETLAEPTLLPEDLTGEVDAVPLDGDEMPVFDGDAPEHVLLGRLAAGAMGEILIVKERDLRRKVALKRMHPELAKKPRLARRFLHEAQITAQLDHPNIVPVYRWVPEDGALPSYTMKLVRGRTFAELIREAREVADEGRSPMAEHALPTLLEHFVRACDALAYAHSRGVVHRDLKPENIMVGAYGEVYVMDWGIARVMGSREGTEDAVQVGTRSQTHRTRLGAILGTPAYMSPEQALGKNDELDARSDVFALGLILSELVSLRAALTGTNTVQLMGRAQSARLEAPTAYRRGEVLAPALVAIIQRATREHPTDRYPTAAALADEVRRFLRGEPVDALPEGSLQRMSRWIGRHRVLGLSALVAFLTLAMGITVASMASTLYTVRAASLREAQLSRLQSQVATRARTLDARFQVLPAHLEALANVTLQALALREVPEGPESQYYLDIGAAPDLQESSAYGRPVSLHHPNTVLPLRVRLADQRDILGRLATLGPSFRRILLASHGAGAGEQPRSERTRRLLEDHSGVRWVYLALANGVGLSYPGHPGVPPGLDLRREPWYDVAVSDGAVWGEVRRRSRDRRSLLPLSRGVFDEDGFRVGAVALEVSLEDVVGDDLSLDTVGRVEAYLLDGEGRILLSTEDVPDVEGRGRWLRPPRFDDPTVLAAMELSVDGWREVTLEDGETDLVVWSRLGALGWTYLVRGRRDVLMR